MKRFFRRAAVLVLGISVLPLLVSAPAHAGTAHAQQLPELEILQCLFSTTVTFDPGLTLTPRAQDVGGQLQLGKEVLPFTPCISPTGLPIAGGVTIGEEIEGAGTLPAFRDYLSACQAPSR